MYDFYTIRHEPNNSEQEDSKKDNGPQFRLTSIKEDRFHPVQ